MFCRARPYEGDQPYIFVSYCHQDAPQVYPVLEQLAQSGFRLWYDNGLHAGENWPEVIAQHLGNCAAFLAAVTPASSDSHNCRNEMNLAVELGKPMVCVLMEEFPLSLALRLQIGAYHYLKRTHYPDDASFMAQLLASPVLCTCLGPRDPNWAQEPPVIPAAENVQPEIPQDPQAREKELLQEQQQLLKQQQEQQQRLQEEEARRQQLESRLRHAQEALLKLQQEAQAKQEQLQDAEAAQQQLKARSSMEHEQIQQQLQRQRQALEEARARQAQQEEQLRQQEEQLRRAAQAREARLQAQQSLEAAHEDLQRKLEEARKEQETWKTAMEQQRLAMEQQRKQAQELSEALQEQLRSAQEARLREQEEQKRQLQQTRQEMEQLQQQSLQRQQLLQEKLEQSLLTQEEAQAQRKALEEQLAQAAQAREQIARLEAQLVRARQEAQAAKAAAAVAESAPEINEKKPSVEETVPSVEEKTSVVEESAPPAKEEKPAVEKTAPPVAQSTQPLGPVKAVLVDLNAGLYYPIRQPGGSITWEDTPDRPRLCFGSSEGNACANLICQSYDTYYQGTCFAQSLTVDGKTMVKGQRLRLQQQHLLQLGQLELVYLAGAECNRLRKTGCLHLLRQENSDDFTLISTNAIVLGRGQRLLRRELDAALEPGHARLWLSNERAFVRSAKSGTTLDKFALTPEREYAMKPGSLLRLGNLDFRYTRLTLKEGV